MNKKVREANVYFYDVTKRKYCKITIDKVNDKDVEIKVTWKNVKDYDHDELWYKAAKTYIENIK
jgi:hypothetical protein